MKLLKTTSWGLYALLNGSHFWKLFALPSWRHEENWAILKIKTTWFMAHLLVVVMNTNSQYYIWVHTSKIFQIANFCLFQSIIDMQKCISRVSWCKFLAFCISVFFSFWLGNCWTFIFQIWFCVSVELKLNSQIKNMLKFLWLVKFDNQSKNNFEIVHIFPFWRFD